MLTDILSGHGGSLAECTEGGVPQHRKDSRSGRVLEIYGPLGLRELLRTTFRLSYTVLSSKVAVHELLFSDQQASKGTCYPNEVPGHDFVIESFRPASDSEMKGEATTPVEGKTGEAWCDISTDHGIRITAVPIVHTVPCVGYIVTEDPICNTHDTRDRKNHPDNGPEYHLAKRGRQIVILGDTSDASSILPFVSIPVDLLLHESTNAFLKDYARPNETLKGITERAVGRGHSTPQMAGRLARACKAKKLVLVHFSARYSGGKSAGARKVMQAIADAAKGYSASSILGGEDEQGDLKRRRIDDEDENVFAGEVITATDGMVIDIPYPRASIEASPTTKRVQPDPDSGYEYD